jgi:hypothetical protein
VNGVRGREAICKNKGALMNLVCAWVMQWEECLMGGSKEWKSD